MGTPDKITDEERAKLATRSSYTFFNGISIEFRDIDKWAIVNTGRAEEYIGPVTLERCRKEGKLGL